MIAKEIEDASRARSTRNGRIPLIVKTKSRVEAGILDTAFERLNHGDSMFSTMDDLIAGLHRIHKRSSINEWKSYCLDVIQRHPLLTMLHQAPGTRRAFEKPRGYPGDAIVLDYMYQELICGDTETKIAHRTHEWENRTPGSRSVRARRSILSHYIDETATLKADAHILSVACGHLREAQRSHAVQARQIKRFIAFDQDEKSLEIVAREQSQNGVEVVQGSVRGLLKGIFTFEKLDLVYAAGLYDYLSLPVARQLTKNMFGMLAPRGKLLVANFSAAFEDRVYLEAVMDWWLIYRTDEEVRSFADSIEPSEISSLRTFTDPYGSIIFLEIEKK